jgi:hypothetical protein
MVWLIVGEVGVLIVVASACVWLVVALLDEVGEEQVSPSAPAEFESANDQKREHGRVYRD